MSIVSVCECEGRMSVVGEMPDLERQSFRGSDYGCVLFFRFLFVLSAVPI